jgi:hypothetical protein
VSWTRVSVPYDSVRAFTLVDIFQTGNVTPVETQALRDWLQGCDEGDFSTHFNHAKRVMEYAFYDAQLATLFKLTWGGR